MAQRMRLHLRQPLKGFAVSGWPRNGDDGAPGVPVVDIATRYDQLSDSYDAQAQRMRWLGFPEGRIHARSRRILAPQPGERIVVVGGGTGQDVVPIADAVGPEGRVWNVDISQGMLEVSRRRCDAAGIDAEHVLVDAADWQWPSCDAVVANFTLLFQPRWRHVLEQASRALGTGGRLVAADLELPWGLRHLATPMVRRFGHSSTTLARRPMRHLAKHWQPIHDSRFFFGLGRLVCARPPMPSNRPE